MVLSILLIIYSLRLNVYYYYYVVYCAQKQGEKKLIKSYEWLNN